MKKDRSKVTPYSVRFDPAVKAVVEAQAKADMRSGAAWIEKKIVELLRAEGLMPNDADS